MIPGVDAKLKTGTGEVSIRLDGDPSNILFVLAHGAGAGMHHPFMSAVAAGLAAEGIGVLRFNFLYSEQSRKAPDRQPVLQATFADVAEHARSVHSPAGLFLGGKSMGGRIASHLVAAGDPSDGLVFLGYPLHPPGRPDRIRDAHLYDIAVPMLFVEGTRDPFCPLDTLTEVRRRIAAPNDLVVIDDGDHSFRVRKSQGRTNAEALDEVIRATAGWLKEARRSA